MHRPPYLPEWLRREQLSEIRAAVAEAIDHHGEDPPVDPMVARLVVEPVTLGRRFHDDVRWPRTMTAGDADVSLLRRGIYPGQQYQHHYDVYRLEVSTGAKVVTVGADGGPLIDPDFVFLDKQFIVIRAADDAHRDRQIGDIEHHIEKANDVIEQWNTSGLPDAVRSEIEKQVRSQREETGRTARKEAAGFELTPPSRTLPLPLPRSGRRRSTGRSASGRTPTGVSYNVTEEQFSDIVDSMVTHQRSVETRPGYGPPPKVGEDRHRDALLGALNQSFHDATAETFSKQGKTDIRILLGEHSYFLAECKIWDGAESVSEAIDQLLERYMTYRDRYGAIVLFIRGIAHPEDLPAKVMQRLSAQHGGQRLNDVRGVPVVSVRTAQGRTVILAVLMIVVDSAPLPS